mgnify:CR=1 FL=1
MKAALHTSLGHPLVLVDDVKLREPRAGEVLIQNRFCGVCHSDVSVNDLFELTPMILGHEAAGIVEEIGDGVGSVSKGDSVLMSPIGPCDFCEMCQRGKPTLCIGKEAFMFGTFPDGTTPFTKNGNPVYQGLGVGGFSEYTLLKEESVVRIKNNLPLETVCVIGCAVQTGVGAVLNTAKVHEGATVLVLGLGGVGISVVQGAKIAGASQIIVSDLISERRELSSKFGATDSIDPTEGDVVEMVMEITKGRGVDFAFEAAGSSQLIEVGVNSTCSGGTTILVGAPPVGAELKTSSALHLMLTEKRIIGSLLGSSHPKRDIPLLLNFWENGKLDLENLITQRYPLKEVNNGFDDIRSGIGLRSVIEIHAN